MDERICRQRSPAARVPHRDLSVHACSLDPLLVLERVPETTAFARVPPRYASRHVRRSVDVDHRQLAVGDTALVDQRYRFRGPIESDQRLGLEQIKFRARDGDQRPGLVAGARSVTVKRVERRIVQSTCSGVEADARVVAEVLPLGSRRSAPGCAGPACEPETRYERRRAVQPRS